MRQVHLVRVVLLVSILGSILCGSRTAWSRDSSAEEGPRRVAVGNTAYVKADGRMVRETWERAARAIEDGDWDVAVRHLQQIVDAREDAEHPGAVAPYVLPVFGSVVYEGAWAVAHHRILEGGDAALAAYERIFGGEAEALLERGVVAHDADSVAEVVDRFLPLQAGRRAALFLADLALEAGDRDAAVGWLQRVQDVEEVSRESKAALAPWTRARVRRQAAATARPERIEAAEARLREAAALEATDPRRFQSVAATDRHPPRPVGSWPTTQATASRTGLPPATGAAFELAWWRELPGTTLDPEWEDGGRSRTNGDDAGPRPSPWLPPRAVVDWPLAFVSDGAVVAVWDLPTGRRIAEPFALTGVDRDWLLQPGEEDARDELGLLEGFSLTLGAGESPGSRHLYVAVPDLTEGQSGWSYDTFRADSILALSFDEGTQRFEELWRAGGAWARRGLPVGTRLYGAPLLYRGRLWIAGIRPASDAHAEAWLFGLSPETGDVQVRTYLATGGPPRALRFEEAVPSSPSGAHGRIVVTTTLGVVASVDARTGRPLWLYLNDRGVASGGRPPLRLGSEPDTTSRESGFANQPALLTGEQVLVAPTDGPYLYSLFDRPRGPSRTLVRHRLHMLRAANHFSAEHIAGLHPGAPGIPPILVLVGKGASPEGGTPAPLGVGFDPETLQRRPWRAHGTTGYGAEPYGVAVLTAGEVWIPQRHGISAYDLVRGRDLTTLDLGSVPPRLRQLVPQHAALSGNVIPVPGKGFFVLNASLGAFWKIRAR